MGCSKSDGTYTAQCLCWTLRARWRDWYCAFSPQQATISALLTHIRRRVILWTCIRLKDAVQQEAIEAIAHGGFESNGPLQVLGKQIQNIRFPPGRRLGASCAKMKLSSRDSNTVIKGKMINVILFLVRTKFIWTFLEKLFQPVRFSLV